MQGKTIAVLVVGMLVCGIAAFTIFSNSEDVPAVTSNIPNNKYIREEGCTILNARELNDKIFLEESIVKITPDNGDSSNQNLGPNFPSHWKIYEKNDRTGKNTDEISHDPPPEYKQSAQTFTVGATGPNENFYLTQISIKLLYFSTGSGEVYCDVRTLAGREPSLNPTNNVLGSSSLYDDGEQKNDKFWNFTFAPAILLEGGKKYCFVLRVPGSALCKSTQYGTDVYPGGHRCITTNDGKSWQIFEKTDLYNWIIYGYSIANKSEITEKIQITSIYPEFYDGDCIIIYDAISTIQYYPNEDYTGICFSWHPSKDKVENSCFNFEGDITDIYKSGDIVEITLHLLHINVETDDMIYDMDTFDEQWWSNQFFKNNVEGYLIDSGLKPISPDAIYCRRSR